MWLLLPAGVLLFRQCSATAHGGADTTAVLEKCIFVCVVSKACDDFFCHSMRHAPVSVVACWLRVYIGVCRPHGFALHVAYPSSWDVLAVLPPVRLELFPVLFWVSGGGLISCARWTFVTSGLVHNGWTRSPGDVMQPHGDTSTGKEKEGDCKSCNPSQPLMIHAVCVNAFYLPVLPPTS